uniref:Uncharacterized protein n=1 Tax=Meloidogyne enterolobii TaxID=390850 RepID=A0A6V7XMH1_MELEN|nr:unnamed protein product [Meloidogyne enterolobii]
MNLIMCCIKIIFVKLGKKMRFEIQNFLPPEVQLDILKFLNFDQLLSLQLTNCYFSNFITEYEVELARKEFHRIKTIPINKRGLSYYHFFKPEPKFYDFQLSEELVKKWKYGIEKSIPMFLTGTGRRMYNIACVLEESLIFKQDYLY